MADYADMAIRTAAKRAYLTGEGEKRNEWGIHTVIVNKRNSACPLCVPFCGKVLIDDVYSGGNASEGEYPLMSSAMAAGFLHPRCKDIYTTYFDGISTPPKKSWSKEELSEIEGNARKEEKQRYAKYQENRMGRLANGSLDEDNKKRYSARADQWEKNRKAVETDTIVKQSEESKKVNIEPAGLAVAREASLRTKSGGSNGVNWKVVKSKEYNKRLSVLSKNDKANELAAQRSRNALVNRNGKNTEELYAISLTTGNDVTSITDQHNPFGVKRTKKFDDDILRAEEKGEKVLFIHNHPNGTPPSIADLNELFNHEKATGITVGHNGSIYYYTKPKKIINEDDFVVAEKHFKNYNDDVARHEKAIELLADRYGFVIRKL